VASVSVADENIYYVFSPALRLCVRTPSDSKMAVQLKKIKDMMGFLHQSVTIRCLAAC
jgi:hypothetical protein